MYTSILGLWGRGSRQDTARPIDFDRHGPGPLAVSCAFLSLPTRIPALQVGSATVNL